MNEYDVKRLALVLAVQAEIEGMKAANIFQHNNGYNNRYGEQDFKVKATELRNLAAKYNEQL